MANDLEPKPPDLQDTFFKTNGIWTKKYIIMRLEQNSTKKTFKDFSPFNVCRFIKSFCPQINLKFLKNGSTLLIVNNEKDFLNLNNVKVFQGIKVKFELHKSLNFSRGVAYVPELINCSEDEIVSELEQHGVVNVKRIFKKINNENRPTPLLILTFERSELPERIAIDFMSIRIRAYEPKPLLCFNCYKYRHTKKYCNIVNCGNCGETTHSSDTCPNAPKCLNCQGEHPAYYTKCPVYEREKKIEKLRTQDKISYKQAEIIIRKQEPFNNEHFRTVAEVVKAPPTTTPSKQVNTVLTETLLEQIAKLTSTVEVLSNKITVLELNVMKSKPETNFINSEKLVVNLPKKESFSGNKSVDNSNEQTDIYDNSSKQITTSKISKAETHLKRNRPPSTNSSISDQSSISPQNKPYQTVTKQKSKIGKKKS